MTIVPCSKDVKVMRFRWGLIGQARAAVAASNGGV